MPYTVEQYKNVYESLKAKGRAEDAAKIQDAFRAEHPAAAAAYYARPQPIPGEAEAAPAPKQRSFAEQQARGLGLATRAMAPALAGAATGAAIGSVVPGVGTAIGGASGAIAGGMSPFLADLYALGKSKITGKQPEMYPSQALEQALTKIGLPQPESGLERGVVNVLGQIPGIYAPQTLARGLISGPAPVVTPTTATGRTLGLLAGPEAQTTGAAVRAAAMQGAQAIAGEVAAQNVPEGWGETARLLTELGAGAAGTWGPGATRETINAVRQSTTPRTERDRNIAVLQAAGVPLTPAMTMGGTVPAAVEHGLKNLPVSAGMAAKADEATQGGFTRALLRMAGIDANAATPETLRKAQEDFSDKFESTYGRLNGIVDAKNDENFIGNAYAEQRTLQDVAPEKVNDFANRSRDLIARMSGEIDPYKIQSALADLKVEADKSLASTESAERRFGKSLKNLREYALLSLEKAAARSGDEGLKDDIESLHRSYARFNSINSAMKNAPQESMNTGFIPVRQINNEAKKYADTRYMMSEDPWVELIRAASAVIPNPTKDSGTAARQYYRDLLTGKPVFSGLATVGTGAGLGAATGGEVVKNALVGAGLAATSAALPGEIARRWYNPIPAQGLRPTVALRQPVAGLLMNRPPEEE